MKKRVIHELSYMEDQNRSNSVYDWNDGYDRAVCACGWKSAAIQCDKKALVALFEVHAKREDAKELITLSEYLQNVKPKRKAQKK